MSRTFKDRPYWVRANDPMEPRIAHHDHTALGTPIYKYENILDSQGNQITEEIELLYWTFDENSEIVQRYRKYSLFKKKKTIVGYFADDCSLYEKKQSKFDKSPCYMDLSYQTHSYDRPEDSQARRRYHSSKRIQEHETLRYAKKLYNSDGDIDFFTDESIELRKNFHRDYWA